MPFWEVFAHFLIGKGTIFGPKSGLRKSLLLIAKTMFLITKIHILILITLSLCSMDSAFGNTFFTLISAFPIVDYPE